MFDENMVEDYMTDIVDMEAEEYEEAENDLLYGDDIDDTMEYEADECCSEEEEDELCDCDLDVEDEYDIDNLYENDEEDFD